MLETIKIKPALIQQAELPFNDWEQLQKKATVRLQEKKPATCSLPYMKIMVVDDLPLNVKVACAHLKAAGYKNIVTQNDPTKALTQIYRETPDVILLDIMMPKVSGLDILEAIRSDHHIAHIPVLILTASTENELKIKALELGATDLLNKPIDTQELLPRVHNALTIKMHQDHLESMIQQRTAELIEVQREVVHCLARASEYRDHETGHHVIRVGKYVELIARELGMDSKKVEMLKLASTLLDMGKIGIPDAILLKPGKLTHEEFGVMKNHCGYGQDICSHSGSESVEMLDACNSLGTIMLNESHSPLLKLASLIAATHHEKWDGSGYPAGLKGNDIPLEGRIVAVADVFDARSSKRPYKEPFPLEKCIAIIEEGKGSHFDAQLVDLFLENIDEVVEIRNTYGKKQDD